MMEARASRQVALGSVGEGRRCPVELPCSWPALCERIGLRPASAGCFGLFGVLEDQTRFRVAPDGPHLPDEKTAVLCLCRLTLRASDETALLKDDVALEVLSNEVLARVDAGDLEVSDAQMDQLDEWRDPAFPCHRQIVTLAHTLPDYASITFAETEDCILTVSGAHTELLHDLGVASGRVAVSMNMRGLGLQTAGKHRALFPWTRIRKWTIPDGNLADGRDVCEFAVEFCLSASQFLWLTIATRQAHLMAESVQRVTSTLKLVMDGPSWPELKDSPATRGWLAQLLFSGSDAAPAPTFTSIGTA